MEKSNHAVSLERLTVDLHCALFDTNSPIGQGGSVRSVVPFSQADFVSIAALRTAISCQSREVGITNLQRSYVLSPPIAISVTMSMPLLLSESFCTSN